MAIEVISVPKRHRSVSKQIRRLWRSVFQSRPDKKSSRRLVLKSVVALLSVAGIFGSDALLRSYKYYSRIIDARLATGYLTSRPGLYAAPRTLRAGQGFTIETLATALQRAGYTETNASQVWSGCFKKSTGTIELRPRRLEHTTAPRIMRIEFSDDKILALTGDDLPLESFTLEPEVLTNELSAKNSKREH